jgi:hypothetical protein
MTGCERVLARLRQGPASHLELYQLGVIAHSRISDLRRKGYSISCEKKGDLYEYSLLKQGEPNEPMAQAVVGAPSTPPVPQTDFAVESASPCLNSDVHKTGTAGSPEPSAVPAYSSPGEAAEDATPTADPRQLSLMVT